MIRRAKDFVNSPDGQDTWRIFRIMAEFVEGFEVMAPVGPAVTIFGSARTRPQNKYYKAAEETGRLFAKRKLAVITGGGPGIMEAANKGAFEAGGQSIGLNISLPQEQEANKYQTISLDFHYFYARKVMFTKYGSAFICFPGGFGTLDEFFETMTLIQTMKVPSFPVMLFGSSHWKGLVDWIKTLAPHYTDAEDTGIFRLVDDPEECVSETIAGMKKHWWKPADELLQKAASNGKTRRRPLEGAKASDTGEGTVYGKRPRHSEKKHAQPEKKPQQ